MVVIKRIKYIYINITDDNDRGCSNTKRKSKGYYDFAVIFVSFRVDLIKKNSFFLRRKWNRKHSYK